MAEPMTAPQKRAGGLDANARGIAVLVAAVVIGFLLLLNAGDDGDGTTSVSTKTTTTVDTSGLSGSTTTTNAGGSTSTTAVSGSDRKPGDVSVLVLNADGPVGSALSASTTIGAKGYKMGTPTNANSSVTLATSAVYYAEGYQAEATAVALVLGKAASTVQPMPSPVPGPGADKANVVVVLGKDTVPAGTSASTTSTTAAN